MRLIVPVAPAGATDIVARLMGQSLSKRLGQQFLIENRPGAGGTVGTEAVVRASPDGYTLFLIAGAHTVNATAGPCIAHVEKKWPHKLGPFAS